jgi:ribosomal protein L16 Arg81 hydroxylase
MPTMDWLLSPVSREEFFDSFFEKQHCIISRSDPEYYRSILGIGDLDSLLGSHLLKAPDDIAIVQADRDIASTEFLDSSGNSDARKVVRQFVEGATIIFSRAHLRIPALRRLCTSLSHELLTRAQTNIYVTPKNSQGFKPHWDTHDVLVLQVSGRKTWSLYNTHIELPLRGQTFKGEAEYVGEMTSTFVLNPGDIAYIPRGLVHSAQASEETSVHITTGLVSFTWADYLLQGVSEAALGNIELRKSLPADFLEEAFQHSKGKESILARLELANQFIASSFSGRYFQEELFAAAPPCFDDLLIQSSNLSDITPDWTVRLRQGSVISIKQNGETLELSFCDNTIELPAFTLESLNAALSGTSIKIRNLPGTLDEGGKVVLVKRLVKEGLVQATLKEF